MCPGEGDPRNTVMDGESKERQMVPRSCLVGCKWFLGQTGTLDLSTCPVETCLSA